MLQHLSWSVYATGVTVAAVIYYGLIGLTYYRDELENLVRRLTGKTASPSRMAGDLFLPSTAVAGAIREEGVDVIDREELIFSSDPGESREPDGIVQPIGHASGDSHLLGELSEMVSETKTLIRVIQESGESKENFEILFRLIVQKYPDLAGTGYEEQINNYLLHEATEQFSFSLTSDELKIYWLNDQKLQNA